MAVQIKPAVQSLPATTAIQDPAARQFADAVTQAVQSINSAEFAAQALVTALEQGLRGGGMPGGVAADGDEGGITAGMISSILQSRLYQALGRAIERIPIPGEVRERVAALETGLTTESSVRATEREMAIQQLSAAVARIAGAEAGVYQETLARASADEAMTSQIDGAVSRLGVAEAGLLSEKNTRATSDTALVQAINTMWAMTGASNALIQSGGTVQTNWNWVQANWWNTLQAEVFTSGGKTIRQAIAQEAELRSGTDGGLLAQYTVKIDSNGYVSGFGLASTVNNAVPYSEFIVRADRFAIGSPGVPGRIPFVVLTSTDGNANPPGVYMDDAFIRNASIGTLRIAGEAVTLPRAAAGFYSASVSLHADIAMRVVLIGTFTQGSGRLGQIVRLLVDGGGVAEEKPRDGTTGAMSNTVMVAPGWHTFSIAAAENVGDMRCGITVLGVKR